MTVWTSKGAQKGQRALAFPAVDVAFLPWPTLVRFWSQGAMQLCVPESSLPPSTVLAQTVFWFKTYFCKRGLGGSQGPAIVISLCFGSTASHEGFFFWAYPTVCWDRVDFQGKEVTITDRLVKSDTRLHILNSSHRWLHPRSLSSKRKSEALVHGGDNNSFIQWLLAGSLPAELHTA